MIYVCIPTILLFHIRERVQPSNLPGEFIAVQHYSIFLLFTVRDVFCYCYRGLDSGNTVSTKLRVFTLLHSSPEARAPLC